jgi:Tol biopolymer transport system component
MRNLFTGCCALGILFVAGSAAAATHSFPPPGSIVFSKQTGSEKRALFVGRTNGSGAAQITEGPNDYNPQWSPDGRRIVFERSAVEGDSAVWIVNADGTGERELHGGPYAEHPRWSPDGRWIAFQVQTSEDIGGGRAHTTYELWLIRPNGSGLRLLVANGNGSLGDENPRFYVESGVWAWSSDSRRIALVWPRRTADEAAGGVRIIDVATAKTRYLGRGTDVAWSPDGRMLAVTTNDQGIIGEPECGTLWIVAATDGKRRRLVKPREEPCDRFPRWSPDGRMVVFERSWKGTRFLAAPTDGSRLRNVRRLRPGAHRWPTDCSKLFEYVNPLGAGWVVTDTRGQARFVPALVEDGDWRCPTSRSRS